MCEVWNVPIQLCKSLDSSWTYLICAEFGMSPSNFANLWTPRANTHPKINFLDKHRQIARHSPLFHRKFDPKSINELYQSF
jgi:hypothetical protein